MEQVLAVKAHSCEKGSRFKLGKLHPEEIGKNEKEILFMEA